MYHCYWLSHKFWPFLLLKTEIARSISWLLMPWLLALPGHQQPWYWLCRALSTGRKDFIVIKVLRNDRKCKFIFMFSKNKFKMARVKAFFLLHWLLVKINISDCYLDFTSCFYFFYLNVSLILSILWYWHHLNSLRPRQSRPHFPDYIFKWVFWNKSVLN